MTLTTGTGAARSYIGNSIMRKLLLVCAALIVTLPASAAVRYVRGGFGFGPAFGPWGYATGMTHITMERTPWSHTRMLAWSSWTRRSKTQRFSSMALSPGRPGA